MAKGKYYTPEFKEQAVKMLVGLDCTYDGSRPSRTGRVAAPDCLTHMCHHVHAADQRDLYLALLQNNDHSTVPGPVIASSLLPIAAKIRRRSVSQCS